MDRPFNIVVGVTGGIAAYKAVLLVRELVLAGHEVRVIATESALRFVGAPTWEAISRHPLNTSIFDDVAAVRHVALGQQADVVVIAPATANTIAKLATGLADDLLGTTVLASRAPLVIAPAMHTEMWQHPATVANIRTLAGRGVTIVGPGSGRLTGADVGPGRMSEPDEIAAAALAAAALTAASARETPPAADLDGQRVLVTAGGTREPIDPVRFLGNRSSGKQGAAFALAARARGADVTVLAANMDAAPVAALDAAGIARIDIETAAELAAEVARLAPVASVVVMTAAVADFAPAEPATRKLKKLALGERTELVLTRTPDILGDLLAHPVPGRTVVGFAAETAADRDELLALAREKIARKPADLLVANAVGGGRGFGTEDNSALVLDSSGAVVAEVSGSKRAVADAVLDLVVRRPA
ncbi:MAG: bifunctional phosphopantothenoylcysteine decarboxylase/phosphopantothenate--cysteine ligase CoaBC [Microbacterium sp.]|uniref:bifunctional phosphopantothenoylcysteine decarboxylase/phosphopantothenate--cysteine ligase CoaBC n=1 Tax=Microbacterium sp. TaxID=51671 RepID=UPI000DB4E771|nr:bifunctional phosphopantothenoylcysteine decarboxylase/phosphopantothenate--cysteine ligase CoaBC [Microbacterium sp.]PZU39254.1 MAG: bifunctional phosphopantothenoylcysteine decarboxylase/phosphopantothenate--cysteine ligase CoaBC [Microbacterium sp.]